MAKTQGQSGTVPGDSGLEFQIADLQSEVKNFAFVCRPFLEEQSQEILGAWLRELESFHDSRRSGPWRWAISENEPIRTIESGDYESGTGHGGPPVRGELTCVWEIESKTVGKKKGKSPIVRLTGIASTKIKIIRSDSETASRTIAQWQFEVGDHQSPGCHFHVGIGPFGSEAAALPVPRLPSILFTPVDALDFLLGEIFQSTWREAVNRDTQQIQHWSARQRKRMSELLKWKQKQVDESGGSAWNYLKHQRPGARLFLTQGAE